MALSVRQLLAILSFIQVALCDHDAPAGGSCLKYNITVCCTQEHCPTPVSPDGCGCDELCHQFSDCCDDIDQVCVRETCVDGDIRLVGGATSDEGRVEVCVGKVWGTICDDNWTGTDARVLCNELGLPNSGAQALLNSLYGQGDGPIHATEFSCVGNESSIWNCSYSNDTDTCTHSHDASVKCGEAVCQEGDIRLVGGRNEVEGRVEVCRHGTWGTICDDGWDINDARVICNQLNYTSRRILALSNGHFGAGSGAIHVDDMLCDGTESSWTECPFNSNTDCTHYEDAGVICEIQLGCIDGSVQLVDGGNETEGRLEVCINGAWTTVCNSNWNDVNAKVVCRQLGHTHEGAVSANFSAGGSDRQVYLTDVSCNGREHTLMACDYSINDGSCTHDSDVGLRCLPGPGDCSDGEVRLVDGTDEAEGRVEVCLFETWSTICSSTWSTSHAEVVCRQLNYPTQGAVALTQSYFGIGMGPIRITDISCDGSEDDLFKCSYDYSSLSPCLEFERNGYRNDVGVRCPCNHGDVRLVGGSSPLEGRVEVCVNGVWGTVTDDGWQNIDSNVVCRQLGYFGNVSIPVIQARYGQGKGPIFIDSARCSGNEERLIDCPYDPNTLEDTHAEDAGVQCFNGSNSGVCISGQLRLVGGDTEREGRLEACLAGFWITVCDNSWDIREANVVCGVLGYPRIGTAYPNRWYPFTLDVPIVSNLQCTGAEDSLFSCYYTGAFCRYFQDAGVKCYQSDNCTEGEVRLVDGYLDSEGRVELCREGVWGTINDPNWGASAARVVCKQLGYFEYIGIPRINSYFGAGSGPVVLTRIRCGAGDDTLTDCGSRIPSLSQGISHSFDVGVSCYVKDPEEFNFTCTTGELRLMGGEYDNEGRLELCINGTWGSVCDNSFTPTEANVACNQLGYPGYGASAFPAAHFGEGEGPVQLIVYNCEGHEDTIFDCLYTTNTQSCPDNSRDVSVRCLTKRCSHGDVRLVDGSSEYEGRVEVCLNGVWGTVCDDFWSNIDAQVICRQLGHSDIYALGYNSAYFGQGLDVPILLDTLQCLGNETSVLNCSYETHTADCSHTEDAGVLCYPKGAEIRNDTCNFGDLRLVNGDQISNGSVGVVAEGRAEVCLNNTWGTICSDRFQVIDARVICRQLGFSELGATVILDGNYTSTDAPIYVDNALCFGEESRFLDCLFDPHTEDCSHEQDVGVRCYPKGQCTDGDIRLVNGSIPTEGRVEVCVDSVWGTVTGRGWNVPDAKVACSQLGYSNEYVLTYNIVKFGKGEGAVHFDYVDCVGNESSLFNCSYQILPAEIVNPHDLDAGVRCFNLSEPSGCEVPGELRLSNGSTPNEGRLEVCFNGVWGTICGGYWIEDDGLVACSQLGYSKYVSLTLPPDDFALSVNSSVPIYFVPLCSGEEEKLTDCPMYHDNSCTHASDTAIKCFEPEGCTEGDIRLVNGSSSWEGRLEVCQHGVWGTVCDDLISKEDARVVCRNLGLSVLYATAHSGAFFGEGTGPIHMDNVVCVGSETRLLDCAYDSHIDDCTHSKDSGISCYNTSQCTHGSLRLVGGNYSYEGRVEYCSNGAWGTICDDLWDHYDAITVCKLLGLESQHAVAYTNAYYGRGSADILLDDVDCFGTETRLEQCLHRTSHNCDHSEDASVACYPQPLCTDGDIKVVNGANEYEGRVEVCLNGVYGTVTDDGWGYNDGVVVCRSLGYLDTYVEVFGFARFGQGNGRISMTDVACTGNEDSLLECQYDDFTLFEGHFEDAGVRCFSKEFCINGTLRLAGGATDDEGRVEVCVNNVWASINNNNWNYLHATMVCSELGYDQVALALRNHDYGPGSGPIYRINCVDNETSLSSCAYTQIITSHQNDAGVKCFNISDADVCTNGRVRLVDGSSDLEGRVEVCFDGKWGTICDDAGFNDDAANVVCAELGFATTGSLAKYAAFHGQGSDNIVLNSVRCEGTEDSLFSCISTIDTSTCDNNDDAGVQCREKSCTEGAVRLSDGATDYEGRVELCIGGAWGTVCDALWDVNDARVICRQLNYSDITAGAYKHAHFGYGQGTIYFTELQCTGQEETIIDCSSIPFPSSCSHGQDAGVVCYPKPTESDSCTLGDVRLRGGETEEEGRVEVCLGQEWGTVCDDGWNNIAANVVCQQLKKNYSNVSLAYGGGRFPPSNLSLVLDDVGCTDETKLVQCPHDPSTYDCTNDNEAGVRCHVKGNCVHGNLRLVGSTEHSGIIEVCYDGVWGSIQNNVLDSTMADFFCKLLGYNLTGSVPLSDVEIPHEVNARPVIIQSISCTTLETNALDCTVIRPLQPLDHADDLAVQCIPDPICATGDVRLVGGPVAHKGRVEVCINDTWGTIGSAWWSTFDAIVVCQQLGYSDRIAVARSNSYYGPGTGPIHFTRTRCLGTETSILNCEYSTDVSSHTHYHDASVDCAPLVNCSHGELRIANGTSSSGRVEFCYYGSWGTVRSDVWSSLEARIVCSQLGYSRKYAVASMGTYGNNADLPLVYSFIHCVGTEEYLANCSLFNSIRTARHDVGVQCYMDNVGACSLGDIRLSNDSNGRLEICINGTWGSVCGSNRWSQYEAIVVCRQMGHPEAGSMAISGSDVEPAGNDTAIFIGYLSCSGSEANILDCFYNSESRACSHDDDVGVVCQTGNECTNGDIRLVGGSSSNEGRVEICNNGVWGTICHDLWSSVDALVVCRQLNLPTTVAVPYPEAYFGPGNRPIVVDDVTCIGNETRLIDCYHDVHTEDCTHNHDVGVACLSEKVCSHGDVRLVNGSTDTEGRVEVCVNGVWGSVCHNYWSTPDATVVCDYLDYPSTNVISHYGGVFGESSGPIFMDSVLCDGDEGNLTDCTHSTDFICDHSSTAGVACLAERECAERELRLVNGTTEYEGRVEVCIGGVWGTIAGRSWDFISAAVICELVGYVRPAEAKFNAYFGPGTGPIHYSGVFCYGFESVDLLQCTTYKDNVKDHSGDIGVVCSSGLECVSGDVQLLNGAGPYEGIVEVCHRGAWHTIVASYWSPSVAKLICSSLGYSSNFALPFYNSEFGSSDNDQESILYCYGNEDSWQNCDITDYSYYYYYYYYYYYGYNSHAGVRCYNDTESACTNGDLQLVGGAFNNSGRVEVCVGGKWGTICAEAISNDFAKVACNQMGFSGRNSRAEYSRNLNVTESNGSIAIQLMRCFGDETDLSSCKFGSPESTCNHAQDIGVVCLDRECEHGDVRLRGGDLVSEGRVEVCYFGSWGTVCDYSWNHNSAQAVCRQLGYTSNYSTPHHFGLFSGAEVPVVLDSLVCRGGETSWTDCSYSTLFLSFCSHSDDAGVECFNETADSACSHGDVRLEGGRTEDEGRVEVCVNGNWSTVCDDLWGSNEAEMVCNQLGYSSTGVAIPYRRGHSFGPGTGDISLARVSCDGDEATILDCDHTGSTYYCDHTRDVGVRCSRGDECEDGAVQLVGLSSKYEGVVYVCKDGVWGTIDSQRWSTTDAEVVCQQLGYTSFGAIAIRDIEIQNISSVTHYSFTSCTNYNNIISQCYTVSYPNKLVFNSGVRCQQSDNDTCVAGSVRLVEELPREGRVEVCVNDVWGTIGINRWDSFDARVVCYQLGYAGPGSTSVFSLGGQNPVVLSRVTCNGHEYSLGRCNYIVIDDGNSSDAVAGVRCQAPVNCTDGEVRLMNGKVPNEGRLELCFRRAWGTLRNYLFSYTPANLACRNLGYSGVQQIILDGTFGNATGIPVITSSTYCTSRARNLSECNLSSYISNDVGNDVGLICVPPPSSESTSSVMTTPTMLTSSVITSSISTSLMTTPTMSTSSVTTPSTSSSLMTTSAISTSSVTTSTSLMTTPEMSTSVTTPSTSTLMTTPSSIPLSATSSVIDSISSTSSSFTTTIITSSSSPSSSSSETSPSPDVGSVVQVVMEGISKDEFEKVEEQFKEALAGIINSYCADNTEQCSSSQRKRQESSNVTPDHIKILSVSETDGGLQVDMYVMMPGTTSSLPADVLTEIIDEGKDDPAFQELNIVISKASPKTSSSVSSGSSGDSMSTVTIVVIVIVVLIVAVLVAMVVVGVLLFILKKKHRTIDNDKNLLIHSPSISSSIIVEGDIGTKPSFVFEEKEKVQNEYESLPSTVEEETVEKDETTKF